MAHLRDHGRKPYKPDSHFLATSVCAHAANPLSRKATQTTGSFIAHLEDKVHTYWATGTAAPCTGIFKPIRFEDEGTFDTGTVPMGTYDPDSLWWQHELLHRSVLLDFQRRLDLYEKERNELEDGFLNEAARCGQGNLRDLTLTAFRQAREKTAEWTQQVLAIPLKKQAKLYYRAYWKKQNKKAGIDI